MVERPSTPTGAYPGPVLDYDGRSHRCSSGGANSQDDFSGLCGLVVTYSQAVYGTGSIWDGLACSFFGCLSVDIEKQLINESVVGQGFFDKDGNLLATQVAAQLTEACYASASYAEQCPVTNFDADSRKASSIDDFLGLARDIIQALPGGLRPADQEIDRTKADLEELCRQAKAATPLQPGQTPQSWGRAVHTSFNKLITNSGKPQAARGDRLPQQKPGIEGRQCMAGWDHRSRRRPRRKQR